MFSEKEVSFLNREIEKFTRKVEERLVSASMDEEQRVMLEDLLVTASSIRRKLEYEKSLKNKKNKGTPPILVVDDVHSALQINKQYLQLIGFKQIETAADGAEALKKLKGAARIRKPFGLVVCDWEMPKMSGVDLLQQVRQDKELWATPFYLLSSRTNRADIVKAINIGATGYITKPINQAVMEEKLKEYIIT